MITSLLCLSFYGLAWCQQDTITAEVQGDSVQFLTQRIQSNFLLLIIWKTTGHSIDSNYVYKWKYKRIKYTNLSVKRSRTYSVDRNFSSKFRSTNRKFKWVDRNRTTKEIIKSVSIKSGNKNGFYWYRIERLRHKKAGVWIEKKRHKYRIRIAWPES
mgnify:CR=1 FL=1